MQRAGRGRSAPCPTPATRQSRGGRTVAWLREWMQEPGCEGALRRGGAVHSTFDVARAPSGILQAGLASRAAPARDALGAIRLIVVGQFLARLDGLRRADPDDVVDDLRVAVGRAGVVDEPGEVAVDRAVDHPARVEAEAPDPSLIEILRLAPAALLVGDLLALVVDNALVLGDALGRKHPPAMQLRPAPCNHPTHCSRW